MKLTHVYSDVKQPPLCPAIKFATPQVETVGYLKGLFTKQINPTNIIKYSPRFYQVSDYLNCSHGINIICKDIANFVKVLGKVLRSY